MKKKMEIKMYIEQGITNFEELSKIFGDREIS